jgi:type I restriction enzyme, S subunit
VSAVAAFPLSSLVDQSHKATPPIPGESIWNLTLAQIESHSGRILERQLVNTSELGPSTFPFDSGTVLYSKLRPYLNKVIVAPENGFATTELVPLRCKEQVVLPSYLAYFLRSPKFVGFASNVVAGAKMPRMVMSEFWKYPVPTPSFPEQRRIAAILDQADSLRAKRREAVTELDDLSQSVFKEMFGNPVANPRGWPMVRLGDQTTKMGSGATPAGGDAAYKDSGISLIRSLNVRDGTFTCKDLAHIDDQQAAKLANVQVAENDVLLNITGASVARVCRAPRSVLPARVNQHVMIIRPKPSLNSVFLERLLLSPDMKRHLLQLSGAGATREAITKAQAEDLQFPYPPLALQKDFASRIQAIESLKVRHRVQQTDLDALFASLQHRAFRGEL